MTKAVLLTDPLDRVLAPPEGETEEERDVRMKKEREAKIVSDRIDTNLQAERLAVKKGQKPLKILLLGQSESGKSTTLKNFQLMYEPRAFQLERASWRAVIQLNVVRSFHLILDALTRVQKARESPSSSSEDDSLGTPPGLTNLLEIQQRLAPLLDIEATLIRRLTPTGSDETEATQRTANSSYSERSRHQNKEVAVNSAKPWKETFNRIVRSQGLEDLDQDDGIDWDDPEDPGHILHALSGDMTRLWSDPITQRILEQQNIRMHEFAGFFLDQLERVTGPRYIPSDDDILKARLKTLGVTEHRFKISAPGSLSRDWRIYDVGGHQTQRGNEQFTVYISPEPTLGSFSAAWVPYFDDVDAIIFLAPISCFDQTLAESPKVNRLADSVSLWTSIVKNALLKSTNLILFLNKVDIFRTKLAAGIKLSNYIVSYGDRENDFKTTTTYIREKFADIMKVNSPIPRVFYCHLTTVTDTKSTSYILANLREMILRNNLSKTDLLMPVR